MPPGRAGASERKKPPSELLEFVTHVEVPTILAIARCFVGVREGATNNSGRIVEAFQKIVGDAVGEPWCMSFVQAVVAIWEARTGRLSAWPATEHCQKAANAARRAGMKRATLTDTKPGDVVIWRKIDSTQGHAEIVAEISFSRLAAISDLFTIGGNTGATDPRDGDGVHLKHRGTGILTGFKPPEFYKAV